MLAIVHVCCSSCYLWLILVIVHDSYSLCVLATDLHFMFIIVYASCRISFNEKQIIAEKFYY